MNSGYIQNLRYKLQKRVRRLNSVDSDIYHFSLQQFWGFINSYPVFLGILEELDRKFPNMEPAAQAFIEGKERLIKINSTENEHAAYSYQLLRKCAELEAKPRQHLPILHRIGSFNNIADCLDYFNQLFLEPFYEYIDEKLDDQKASLLFLRRYKQKCESYQKFRLFTLWESDSRRGEKLLGLHLYEYLFDQGLDLVIEPSSVSGVVDLIVAQENEEPLIADVKIFNPDKGRGRDYIAKGLNQIYRYTIDYSEPFGYLVIFNTADCDLRFALKNQNQAIPFVSHNNKTIFLITIDIFPHAVPASKRGYLKSIEIDEDYLIRIIEEEKGFNENVGPAQN